ncbi:MAG: ATP-binding protein [Bacteroidales bacterium]|nr:ATP-binding protein [Bacteroidales bacterium]
MESMVFQVSAKTARLIGRENISDVDGAIVELIKNGYDADADCVFVKYYNPYNDIPKLISLSMVHQIFGDSDNYLVKEYYKARDGEYCLKEDLENYEVLENYIKSLSYIIVLDNGIGMDDETLKTSWMNIGTDDKEKNTYSAIKNRIKTGAKGIGRFALDKLSKKSTVYTRNKSERIYKWEIDWCQFENVKYLNQVEASLNQVGDDFNELVKKELGEDYKLISAYDWSTGTLIKLSPIRDFWSEKLYKKVNANVQNLNPLGIVDRFDVIIKNTYLPELDFFPQKEGIERANYDYAVEASFDGKDSITICLDRNEIDIKSGIIKKAFSENDVEEYSLDEFWNREAFSRDKYKREDFDGEQHFVYSVKEILPANSKIKHASIQGVGPFTLKLYYLKNNKSTVEIIKNFRASKRKEIISKFAGIKIYRDNFKVRPYGEEGQFSDWLHLGERAISSPAAASHSSGKWRVTPNQIVGSVSISRFNNPKLEDSANREGMWQNEEFDAFKGLIEGIISKFEYDRQYPLREYAAWYEPKIKAHLSLIQEVYESVKNKKENEYGKNQSEGEENEKCGYSNAQLEDVIYELGKEKEASVSLEQLMMVLSASGVMAQTFSHEIMRIGTELGSRGQHLKVSIDRLLDYKPYEGDEDFDPYDLLRELDSTDTLLSEWVGLIMNSIDKEKFSLKDVNLKNFLEHIYDIWSPLLEKKYISISRIVCDEKFELHVPEIDLYLILNNFLLNSSYYLEEAEGDRKIEFIVYEEDNSIILEMKNNGPRLDVKYRQNPDETLQAQETSKENGTGLGLWIASEAVYRNNGDIHVVDIENGYMLKTVWIR